MKPRKEFLIALAILAFCILNYFYLIPSQVEAEGSATRYPILLCGMLAVFAVAYAVEAFLMMRAQSANSQSVKDSGPGFIKLYGRTMLLILVTGVWLFSIESAGFILSTFFFLLIASFVFGSKSAWKPLALATIMPLVCYGIFRSLNSMLPEGPIEVLIGNILG